MKRIAFGLFLIVMPLAVGLAVRETMERDKPSDADAAGVVGVGPSQIHFETVSQDLGEIAIFAKGREVVFPFVNQGVADLEITKLEAFCGCTDIAVTRSLIPPGEAGKVLVRLATKGAEKRAVHVAVHSNDPLKPVSRLDIAWRTVEAVELDPLHVNFGELPPGDPVERTVRLIERRDLGEYSDCRIERVETTPIENLSVEVADSEPDSESPATLKTMRVRLTPPERRGTGSGIVRVFLTDGPKEKITLPVRWNVRGVIESRPARLSLGFRAPESQSKSRLVISARENERLEIVDVSVAGVLADAVVDRRRLSPETILLEIACGLPSKPGSYAGNVAVTCSEPDARTITIPVSAVILDDSSTVAVGEEVAR